MGVTVSVDMSGVPIKITRITNNRKLGMFAALNFARHMNKYVPMDTGMLAQNTVSEPFQVTYNQPYAQKIYRGTNLNFSDLKHPLATAYWDKACWNAEQDTIAREISRYAENL